MVGAGDPSRIGAASHVPIWAFHGQKDPTIPLERMTELMAPLRSAYGHPFTRCTRYTRTGSITTPSGRLHEPNRLPWMFAQRRGALREGRQAERQTADEPRENNRLVRCAASLPVSPSAIPEAGLGSGGGASASGFVVRCGPAPWAGGASRGYRRPVGRSEPVAADSSALAAAGSGSGVACSRTEPSRITGAS